MAHIAHSQRGDAHLDLLRLIDSDLRPVSATPASAVLTELIVVGNLVQCAVFPMRIDNQDTGLVMRLHQFFDDDACEVCADEVLDAEDDGHCAMRTCEQRANCRGTGLRRLFAAEDTS